MRGLNDVGKDERVRWWGAAAHLAVAASTVAGSVAGCGPAKPWASSEAAPPAEPEPLPVVVVEDTPAAPVHPAASDEPDGDDPSASPALYEPALADMTAPERFTAVFRTTKGDLTVQCERSAAPHGVDRFYALVKIGFFTDVALYRVVPGFVAQWGIHGEPAVNQAWEKALIPADVVTKSNLRGTVSFAMAGAPTTRATQVFINYADNIHLDAMGFAPICEVTAGMAVADAFHAGYRDQPTRAQSEIRQGGNAMLRSRWPLLDYVISAAIAR